MFAINHDFSISAIEFVAKKKIMNAIANQEKYYNWPNNEHLIIRRLKLI